MLIGHSQHSRDDRSPAEDDSSGQELCSCLQRSTGASQHSECTVSTLCSESAQCPQCIRHNVQIQHNIEIQHNVHS